MKSSLAIGALVVSFTAGHALAIPFSLIKENFSTLAANTSTNPNWSDNDGTPTTHEIYNSGGAGARGMASTYDHDNNIGTPNITIPGGLEVNDGGGPLTLVASLPLPAFLSTNEPAKLSFFAGRRGTSGVLPTFSIFNVTDNVAILGTTAITLGSPVSVWTFNSFNVNLPTTALGDTIEVRWFGGGSGGADGLQLADINFVAETIPEPATASLALLGLGGLMLRRRMA